MKIEIECEDNGGLPCHIWINGKKQEYITAFEIHGDFSGIKGTITRNSFPPVIINDELQKEEMNIFNSVADE